MPPAVLDGENRLQYSYSVWFTQRMRGGSVSSAPSDYEDNIKLIGSFSSVRSQLILQLSKLSIDDLQVEQFWAHYCHLAKPRELPSHCDIHLFKLGIKPMWEVRFDKLDGSTSCKLCVCVFVGRSQQERRQVDGQAEKRHSISLLGKPGMSISRALVVEVMLGFGCSC